MSNVYIFKCTDGTYKVGKADNPTLRKLQVDRFYEVESEIYAWKPVRADNAFKFETKMHNILAKYRTRGEFFQIPQIVLDGLIQKHCFILSAYGNQIVAENKANFPFGIDFADEKCFLSNLSHHIVRLKSDFWMQPREERATMLSIINSFENVYSLY